MTWVAAAIGGSALLGLVGSSQQAGAAESAAQTQLAGTKYAADIQKQMFDLLNFELAVQSTIVNLKSIEGKTREELLEMAQKNLPTEELGQ